MARMQQWIGLSVLGLALTGCVSQDKYNAMKLAHDSAQERLAAAQREEAAAAAEAEVAKRNLQAVMDGQGNQTGLIANLTSQLQEMQRQYSDLEGRYQDAVNRTAPLVLSPEINTALTQFAQQNPDLVEFDSTRGIVKFKSDLTFAVGSAELQPNARQAIGRFAQILNSPEARGYELQVAGHTDNQRVANPNTIKKGHLDNWYLSSHRAISVGNALQSAGVDSKRLAVVGYADQHPVASNASPQGQAQNRRVEVLILPTTVRNGNGGATFTADNSGAPAPRQQPQGGANLNKDTANIDRGPAFNK